MVERADERDGASLVVHAARSNVRLGERVKRHISTARGIRSSHNGQRVNYETAGL